MRYPRGTPYQGPVSNYDGQVSAEAFLGRVVYGRPAPLLAPRKHADEPFYGRLLDELANAHAALVRVNQSQGAAYHFANKLRKELPAELYSVGVKEDPDTPGEWLVLAYNRVTRSLSKPAWMDPPEPYTQGRIRWVGTKQVAAILGVSRGQANRVILKSGIEYRREGGKGVIKVKHADVSRLANRHRRWQHRSAPARKEA